MAILCPPLPSRFEPLFGKAALHYKIPYVMPYRMPMVLLWSLILKRYVHKWRLPSNATASSHINTIPIEMKGKSAKVLIIATS